MFVRSFLKRIISLNRNFSSNETKTTLPTIKFGNPDMPDKLFKRIEIEIRSSERAVKKSYKKFITTAAEHLNIKVSRVIDKQKPSLRRFTLLKSAFVHRKHLVQYEIRTYYSWIFLKHLTGSTANTFLEYIERMLPEGVALKVTKISVEPVPSHFNKIKDGSDSKKKSEDLKVLETEESSLKNNLST